MKRPFDHPRDLPTHVMHHVEVRDLPQLPMNLDWCYPELNMYAQITGKEGIDPTIKKPIVRTPQKHPKN
eukprot:2669524-Amphidinium_carterae.3